MHLTPVEYIIFRFGGVRKTAKFLNRTPSAVSRWRSREQIPVTLFKTIINVAHSNGLDIKLSDLVYGRKLRIHS